MFQQKQQQRRKKSYIKIEQHIETTIIEMINDDEDVFVCKETRDGEMVKRLVGDFSWCSESVHSETRRHLGLELGRGKTSDG